MKIKGEPIRFVILFTFLLTASRCFAQSLPVGTTGLEDFYRRRQLLSSEDSSVSFLIRPLHSASGTSDLIFDPDSSVRGNTFLNFNGKVDYGTGGDVLKLLPVTWQQQYNSQQPYGRNDGPMIPNKGYQTLISAGLFASFKNLSIQLKPEFLYASNSFYEGFNNEHFEEIWSRYYTLYLNNIDEPERFGFESYSKMHWGQSNIKLNFKPVSIGVSTENIWWGPGTRNSLLMSNNAAGFNHITLNTSHPVSTPIGSFEAQFIAGNLINSGYLPPEPNRVYEGRRLYLPKRENDRYLSGFVVTYQPRLIPGLFIGAARTYQMYSDDLPNNASKYIPAISAFRKLKRNAGQDIQQLGALFSRWILRDAKAELYFEYGINSYGYLPVKVSNPGRSKAWIFGMRKLFPLDKRPGELISVNLEVANLGQNVREVNPFYTHGYIRQGYTNNGEVLGAGIGSGSGLQTLDISWFKGLRRIGVILERYAHNNDYYYYAYRDNNDLRKHWVDLNTSLYSDWNYKNLLLTGKITQVHSLNYKWFFIDRQGDDWQYSGFDNYNLSLQLNIAYRF